LNDAALKKRGGQMAAVFKIAGPKRFLEWVDAYLEFGPLGLVDEYHKCGRSSFYNKDEREVLLTFVYKYLSPERPTVASLWRDMEKEITALNRKRRKKGLVDLRCPDDDFLRTEIRRLPPFDVIAARWTPEKATRFFHPSKGGVPGIDRPMQRVEADDWTCDLHTILLEMRPLWDAISQDLRDQAQKVRCVLSAAICCTTRVIPAVTLALNTGASNTRMLLRMCMSDKTALARAVGCETPWEYRATMRTFVVDEGSALINFDTQMICTDLGIALKSPQIETPQQRPKIERWFQTLEIRSLLRFSGRAFSNPVVRDKYESAARACVTVEELATIIVRFIVDEYHNLPHAGLGGETPRACWLRLTKKRAPWSPPGPSRIRRAFGENFPVTLQAQGIEIFGNWYTSPETDDLFQTKPEREYTVRVDSEDLGAVSLRVTGGWLTVRGPDVMKGVSAAVWDAALASLRRQNKDLQDLVRDVVHRAIDFAQKADAETRKRLSILYRPLAGDDFAALRRRLNETVRHRKEILVPQAGPIDILAGAIPVGRKAPRRANRARAARASKTFVEPALPTKRKKSRQPAAKPPQPTPKPGKPPRQWKPKERK
jgi:putative transposase